MSLVKLGLFVAVLGLLGWIIYQEVDLKKVGEALYYFPKIYLLIVLGLSFLILTLKSVRFWVLLRKFTIKTNLWQSFKSSLSGGVTSALPGGEFFRGVLVKHETKEDFTRISGAVISQSYFETSVAVLLMIGGFLVLDDDYLLFALVSLVVVILMALILAFKQSTRWMKNILPEHKNVTKFLGFLQNLQHYLFEAFVNKDKKRPRRVLLELIGITLLAHLLGGVLLWLIFNGMSIQIGLPASVFIYSTSIVISGIGAVIPGGLGITEGGLFGVMSLFGIPPSLSVAVVLLFRVSTLLFSITVGAIFFATFYGKYYLTKWKILNI